MSRKAIFPLVTLFLLTAGSLAAQQSDQAESHLRPAVGWIVDPISGARHAVALTGREGQSSADLIATESASSVTYTGTVNMTLTVKLVSGVPKSPTINCNGSVALQYTVDGGGGTNITTQIGLNAGVNESVAGTISGEVLTCRFSMPYSFAVPASSSTQLVIVHGLNGAASVSEFSGVSTTTSAILSRFTSVIMGNTTGAPAEGAITTFTASTVL
jgi:hypothetical protein